MTLAVCFVPPSSDKDVNHWSFVLTHFAPDSVYVMQDRKRLTDQYAWLAGAIDIETADELPDSPLVLFAPKDGRYVQGETSLPSFEHPESAVYMFGSDMQHMSEDFLGSRAPDHVVYIPTASPLEMYSHVAAAIALYDRSTRGG